uniref:TNase-like domain-containing protein n=1 Tax=Leersia perrieri TaxID=77586 RepID=A0A0D9VW15_9ORYZ
MGNVLRCFKRDDDGGDHYPYYQPTSTPHYQLQSRYSDQLAAPARPLQLQPVGLHGVTPSTLEHNILNFKSTYMVPERLSKQVESCRKAQDEWCQNMLEAYEDATPPPKTPADDAQLIARALDMIERADLEGILENHQASSLPKGVQFVLNTLPVYVKCIGDGDGFTAYVSTTDPRESANVPSEVHDLMKARSQARRCRNYKRAGTLLRSLHKAGYKGIDAPELKMPYGEESQNALVKLIGGKSVKIYVYDLDRFGRYVGDIYCNNLFIQEQMLKNGHVWHFKTYDKRPEFARWEREARAANRGLWASGNPEKPWDWRRDQRNARQDLIQVY